MAEVISFNENFPDVALRGRSFELNRTDYFRASQLKTAIILKQLEADTYVRSCPPGSKDWREQVEHWNQLRRENYEYIKQLRALVSQ
jgi:hypothetical protein